jgi:hypothetical protein
MIGEKIVNAMLDKGMAFFRNQGEMNIVYVEGMNVDGSLNTDEFDKWNDLRLLIDHTGNVVHCARCTTEPGRLSTFDQAAKKRGGVARIAFGQYAAWKYGFHQGKQQHPALVQCATIPVHRDFNRDGIRTGDPVRMDVRGLNQHSTSPSYKGGNVGNWSAGCLVGSDWSQHLEFIRLLRTDPRFVADQNFIFTTAILAGDKIGP